MTTDYFDKIEKDEGTPYSNNSNTVIAVAASVIALLALFVSIQQGCESRKHNRLSVRPAINFVIDISKDTSHPEVLLMNKGLGPGIMKEVQIKVDDNWLAVHSMKDWLNALQRLGLNVERVKWTAIGIGTVIAPNDQVPLLTMVDGPKGESNNEKFRSFLENVKIRIRYESMYADTFVEEIP